ncbi:hypothetical protein M8J76_007670 [Diaphorina citri]|nr:hypothetical protein M8J75_014562 [Diaphorina citri]KAI5708987.1 hypothetical protein M8J76_007670 [Diaphorina citri]
MYETSQRAQRHLWKTSEVCSQSVGQRGFSKIFLMIFLLLRYFHEHRLQLNTAFKLLTSLVSDSLRTHHKIIKED